MLIKAHSVNMIGRVNDRASEWQCVLFRMSKVCVPIHSSFTHTHPHTHLCFGDIYKLENDQELYTHCVRALQVTSF